MQIDPEIPCGRCDVGVYSYASALTPLAFQLAQTEPCERVPPACKSVARACVGACDFIDALRRDPDGWTAIMNEVEAAKRKAQQKEQEHGHA